MSYYRPYALPAGTCAVLRRAIISGFKSGIPLPVRFVTPSPIPCEAATGPATFDERMPRSLRVAGDTSAGCANGILKRGRRAAAVKVSSFLPWCGFNVFKNTNCYSVV
jgi:hypothetical protein